MSSHYSPLRMIRALRTGIWLDGLRRADLTSGRFAAHVEAGEWTGARIDVGTLARIVAAAPDYADAEGSDASRWIVEDAQVAADTLRPVYQASAGADGYLSLPLLVDDEPAESDRIAATARALIDRVGRPNVRVEIPATPTGIPAIERLIATGHGVVATEVASREDLVAVLAVWARGLQSWADAGGDVSTVTGAIAVPVGTIDDAVEHRAQAILRDPGTSSEPAASVRGILGQLGVANAKRIYETWRTVTGKGSAGRTNLGVASATAAWETAATHGTVRPPYLVFVDTVATNPALAECHYIESLIASDVMIAGRQSTLDGYAGHLPAGPISTSLLDDHDAAEATIAQADTAGVSLSAILQSRLESLEESRRQAAQRLRTAAAESGRGRVPASQSETLPESLAAACNEEQEAQRADDRMGRIQQRDAAVWTNDTESRWLGWLAIADRQAGSLPGLATLSADLRATGMEHAVLLGMGGSSLGPDVLAQTFQTAEPAPSGLRLRMLDSTIPSQVRRVVDATPPEATAYLVASKSGSTLEPTIMLEYAWHQTVAAVGEGRAGAHFIAITDPGSKLEKLAHQRGFRAIIHGVPQIGGRFSVLSNFGFVPAATMGLDLDRLHDRAAAAFLAFDGALPVADNPAQRLGILMGVGHNHGQDKLTLIASPAIESLGAWLEQLIAESLGKHGKGVIPVDREPLADASAYDEDRLFAYLSLAGEEDAAQEQAVAALESAGHPVVRIRLADRYDLATEFVRFQVATAVAGSVIGVNPFDQPDVEASKIATKERTAAYESTGALPAETPLATDDARGFTIYCDETIRADLTPSEGGDGASVAILRRHLSRLSRGDYFALLAYLDHTPGHDEIMQRLRTMVGTALGVATCVGFGPRFLHSTGQAYKGGPNTGVFLQLTAEVSPTDDLAVPGRSASFGTVAAAQAAGDLQVLFDRSRPALRIHLHGPDIAAGLAALEAAIGEALSTLDRPE